MGTKISHLPDKIVVDDEITLRAKTSESYDEFARVVVDNVEHLSRWLPWAKNAPDESSVDHYNQAAEKKANNESADWDILIDGKLIGAIGLNKREETGTILEIGYWLVENATGKGVMTKCVSALTDVVFSQTDALALEIGCDKLNLKSGAVPQRCNYILDRDLGPRPESPQLLEGFMYKLTREQWEANKS